MKTRNLKKAEFTIIAIFVLANAILHLVANLNSGFHGDELLYIDAGRHLAAGYMDFSPVIAYLAFIQNLFQSDSIFVNHLFVHVASALIILFTGLSAVKMGGKWLAVLITLSCILFAPGFASADSLFLPVVFENLVAVIFIYLLVCYCNNPADKFLISIGLSAALGLLTKYSIVFLIGGLVFSVLIFSIKLLKNKMLWFSLLLFLVIISPNIIWQYTNGFPFLHHVAVLYDTQLEKTSVMKEFRDLFFYLNPLTAVFWITGLVIVPFKFRYKKYRLPVYTLVFAFIFLFMAKGKSYYYFPVILGILPFSAVFFEHLLQRKNWIPITYVTLVVISGIIILPHGITVLPLDKYIKFYHLKKNGDNKIPLPFENYYSKEIWNKILVSVSHTFQQLPVEEKKNCLVWGRHYSQAGGINLLGRKYGLPRAFSFHGSYYNWVPEFNKDMTIIVITESNLGRDHWLQFFREVKIVDSIENPYASQKNWYTQNVFLCKKLLYNSDQLKQLFKHEIF